MKKGNIIFKYAFFVCLIISALLVTFVWAEGEDDVPVEKCELGVDERCIPCEDDVVKDCDEGEGMRDGSPSGDNSFTDTDGGMDIYEAGCTEIWYDDTTCEPRASPADRELDECHATLDEYIIEKYVDWSTGTSCTITSDTSISSNTKSCPGECSTKRDTEAGACYYKYFETGTCEIDTVNCPSSLTTDRDSAYCECVHYFGGSDDTDNGNSPEMPGQVNFYYAEAGSAAELCATTPVEILRDECEEDGVHLWERTSFQENCAHYGCQDDDFSENNMHRSYRYDCESHCSNYEATCETDFWTGNGYCACD